MVVPNLPQGAALRRLGMLNTDELPMLAAHWLSHFDSPALRQLAGLHGTEGWLIDQLWPEVLCDQGVTETSGEQAWDHAMSYQLAAWRAGERSTNEVMSQAIRAYITNEYPGYVPEAGHLYGLDDELSGGWGRSADAVLADVEKTFAEWAVRLGIGS